MLSQTLWTDSLQTSPCSPAGIASGDKSRNWRVKSVRNVRKCKRKRNMLFSKTSADWTGNISPPGNTCMAVFKCHRCAIFHSSINPKVLKGFQTQGCNIFNKFNLFYTEKNTKLMFLRQNAGNNFYEFKQRPRPCQLHKDCYRTPFYLYTEAEPGHRLIYCGFVPHAACLDPCWQVLTFLPWRVWKRPQKQASSIVRNINQRSHCHPLMWDALLYAANMSSWFGQ